mmetsp:Transcript_3096/g.10149  ORF Transcript_3096/g.10149 Transcript_3096/m.10149 type:complete len:204 (+) Transcript_3096:3040-3651(+)
METTAGTTRNPRLRPCPPRRPRPDPSLVAALAFAASQIKQRSTGRCRPRRPVPQPPSQPSLTSRLKVRRRRRWHSGSWETRGSGRRRACGNWCSSRRSRVAARPSPRLQPSLRCVPCARCGRRRSLRRSLAVKAMCPCAPCAFPPRVPWACSPCRGRRATRQRCRRCRTTTRWRVCLTRTLPSTAPQTRCADAQSTDRFHTTC